MAAVMGIPVPFLDEQQTKMVLVGVGAALALMVVTMPGIVTPARR